MAAAAISATKRQSDDSDRRWARLKRRSRHLLYHSRNDTNEYILRKGLNSPITDSGLSFHLNLQWFYDAAPRGGADGLKIIACILGITVLSLGRYAIIAVRDRGLAIGNPA